MEMQTNQATVPQQPDNHWKYWLQIWTQPRKTMREILDQPTNESHVLLLLLLGGFVYALNQASMRNAADDTSLVLMFVTIIIATLIGAAIYYYIIGGILYWVGTLLGGAGEYGDVRLAIAYSYIPAAVTILLWIPSIILFGSDNFTTETPKLDSSAGLSLIYLIFAVIELAIGIWGIFIFLKCLGEAHQFSAWLALLTVVLPIIGFVVLIAVLFMVIL
ncbi:YIP1 family protein [Xylanibacillus composti]|uniref:YIP1 family protein n=1 Tax=Xylanibacillus composti TaxID=1572762 RepID=A0A8J4H2B5_9BACL|nr:Yip1 family protein [Xylanibacillus composti]GIQ69662.1 YIP1 family protein [Xylanibacillus composti]